MTVKGRPAPPPRPRRWIIGVGPGFRHLGVDIVRFRHRRFDGAWSGERVFDIVRRGAAAAVVLYDPERDCVVLVEQFRLAALFAGRSPWQVEAVAGLIDTDETPEEVARREAREEAGLDPQGPLLPIQIMMPAVPAARRSGLCSAAGVDCRGAGGIHGPAAEQEDIRVVVKTMAEIEAMLDAGRSTAPIR
jgi:ADP-ribose pyrophosphatase